MAYLKHSDF